MKTEIVNISDIKLNPSNPRVIKDDKFKQLVASINELPEMLNLRPIVVNEDMVVLGGNMRLKACTEAGLKKVPIIKAINLTEEQQREFIIKDNIGYGEWDWQMLNAEWDDVKLGDWGLDVPNSQDWTQLDYIEEAEKPNFRKDNVITIIVPDEFVKEMKEIEELVKSTLGVNYSGCEVK
jgi:ParB-like chromosome segregation protein Spo0J